MRTCDECLNRRHHRCTDPTTCACSVCAPMRTRTPRPPKAKPAPRPRVVPKPAPLVEREGKRRAPNEPRLKPGRPAVFTEEERLERKRESMRHTRAQARGVLTPEEERIFAITRSPEYVAEVARLNDVMRG